MKVKKISVILSLAVIVSLSGCGSTASVNAPSAEQIQPEEEPEPTEEELAALRRTDTVVPLLEEAQELALGYYYEEAL